MKKRFLCYAASTLLLSIGFTSNSFAEYQVSQLSDSTSKDHSVRSLAVNDVGDAVFSTDRTGIFLYNGADKTITNSGIIDTYYGYVNSINNSSDFTYSSANGYMLYTAATGTSTSVNDLTVVTASMAMVNDNGDLAIQVGKSWPSFGVGFYDNTYGVYSELSVPSYAGFPEDINNNGDVIWTTFQGTFLYSNATGTTTNLFPYIGGYSFGPYSYANLNDSQDIAYSDRAQRNYWTNQSGGQSYTWTWNANIYVAATGQIVNLGECGSGRAPVLNNNGQAVFLDVDMRNKYPALYGTGGTYTPDEIVVYDLATGVTTQITSNDLANQNLSFVDINDNGDIVYISSNDPSNSFPVNQLIMIYHAGNHTTEFVASTGESSIINYNLHINNKGEVFWIQYDKATGMASAFIASPVITIAGTVEAVDNLLVEGDISNSGTANSLTAILENALVAEEQGNTSAATGQLLAFINSTNARRGRSITDEAADALIQSAQALLNDM
jgi:hypothetical protein